MVAAAQSPRVSGSGLEIQEDWTDLMKAVKRAENTKVRALLTQNPKIGARTSDGLTALMIAVIVKNLDAVKLLAEHEKGLKDNQGRTALMHAAMGFSGAVPHLKEELRLYDGDRRTALMHAVINQNMPAVMKLCAREAGLQDAHGLTALMYAVQGGFNMAIPELRMELRMGDERRRTALMHAVRANNIGAIRQLVEDEKGLRDDSDQTALMMARSAGNVQAVEILKTYERDPESPASRTSASVAASPFGSTPTQPRRL